MIRFCSTYIVPGTWAAGMVLLAGVALLGCGSNPGPQYVSYPDGGSSTGPGTGGTASGLPCDVAQVLQNYCTSCHGNPPTNGAPIPLVTYSDLTAKSSVDPTMTVAQRAVLRMQDAQRPMPPGAGTTVAAADIATVQNWVTAGAAQGTCGSSSDGGTASGPFNTPPVCTSGQTWTLGNRESPLMNPGRACLDCHGGGGGEAPAFQLGGTVYPTGHEPDLCYGGSSSGQATVVITDAAGLVVNLTTTSDGNFYYSARSAALQLPYTARVMFQGRVRAMAAAQQDGNCNSCHTQDGANGAPGRIVLP